MNADGKGFGQGRFPDPVHSWPILICVHLRASAFICGFFSLLLFLCVLGVSAVKFVCGVLGSLPVSTDNGVFFRGWRPITPKRPIRLIPCGVGCRKNFCRSPGEGIR